MLCWRKLVLNDYGKHQLQIKETNAGLERQSQCHLTWGKILSQDSINALYLYNAILSFTVVLVFL